MKKHLSFALALILCFTFGSAVFTAAPIPKIIGVANNTYYKANVKITFTNCTAKLNGKAIKSGVVVSKDGTHKFVYTDPKKAVKTITFYVDKTLPVITLNDSSKATLKSGATTNKSITVTYKEANFKSITITKNGKAVSYPAKKTFSDAGTYIVTVTDKAGNAAKATFTIKAIFVPDYTKSSQINVEGNSVGNLACGGGVAQQGDWIYYATENNGNIYKIKKDGGSRKQLNNEHSYYINVVGDWIYYCSYDGIYKMKTDGSSKVKVVNGENLYVYVVGDWMYYNKAKGTTLYKMKTDGSSNQSISDACVGSFEVVEDWIYYSGKDGIYKVKTDGSSNQLVGKVDLATNIDVEGDWIYFCQENSDYSYYFYKMKTDGSSAQILSIKIYADIVTSIDVVGDRIYCVCATGNNKDLVGVYTDGSDYDSVAEGNVRLYGVVGGVVYYTMYDGRYTRIYRDGDAYAFSN